MIEMPPEILKRRVGRTPLVRAKNLERELNVGKIYLKLEGNNPSGHREDRLAYLIIRDALSRGKKTISMGTFGTVGGSLAYLSRYFDIHLVFYVTNKKRVLRKKYVKSPKVKLVEHGRTYVECVKESKRAARENGWYNANPGLANNVMNMYAFSYIAEELIKQAGPNIDNIFCQTSNGSSISGLHLGLKQLWVDEDIPALPRVTAVSTDHGNAIVETYKKGKDTLTILEDGDTRPSKYNRNLINPQCFNGQDALNAIYDTYGKVVGITDDELVEYFRTFKEIEGHKLTRRNAFPIAAFYKEAKAGNVKDGTHIIILNDGHIDIDIEVIGKDHLDMPYETFLKNLDDWLLRFSDPLEEMKEAVEDAFENGHVICAYHEDDLVGILILSTSKYRTFFPKYHLSYIATKEGSKGKGIATQLIQKAVELTEGRFSLHVETDNKRAIRFYEKMGLRKKYYRMFYESGGVEHEPEDK